MLDVYDIRLVLTLLSLLTIESCNLSMYVKISKKIKLPKFVRNIFLYIFNFGTIIRFFSSKLQCFFLLDIFTRATAFILFYVFSHTGSRSISRTGSCVCDTDRTAWRRTLHHSPKPCSHSSSRATLIICFVSIQSNCNPKFPVELLVNEICHFFGKNCLQRSSLSLQRVNYNKETLIEGY